MVRKREAAGIALLAFGIGLILSVLLRSGFLTVLLGLGCVAAGFLIRFCGEA